jgi:uncharacterized protein (TIGR02246 family)
MHSILSIFISIFSIFVMSVAQASSPVDEIHADLRDLKKTMEKAINQMDIESILQNVTDDVVFTTMNGDLVRGRSAVKQYFESMMKGDERRVESVSAKFEVIDFANLYGESTAVAFGTSEDHYVLRGGDTFSVNARWSATMVKQNGKWLVANFHYSTNMFNNPILEAQRYLGIKILLIWSVFLIWLVWWFSKRSSIHRTN